LVDNAENIGGMIAPDVAAGNNPEPNLGSTVFSA